MSLKLISPGGRRKQSYYARGYVNGKQVEHSLRTTDRATAEIRKAELEIALRLDYEQPDEISFSYAAERYMTFRSSLSDRDVGQVRKLIALMGDKPVQHIVNNDLHEAADVIIPGGKASNKNRWVMRVASAVLHFAAEMIGVRIDASGYLKRSP